MQIFFAFFSFKLDFYLLIDISSKNHYICVLGFVNQLTINQMKKIYILLALLIASLSAEASMPRYLLTKDENMQIEIEKLFAPRKIVPTFNKNFDVQSYSLYMNWVDLFNKADRKWKGENTIKLKVKSDTVKVIELDAASLNIDFVTFDGEEAGFTHNPTNGTLSVEATKALNTNDIYTLVITFSDIEQLGTTVLARQVGLNFYPKGQESPEYVNESIAYTMSEPRDARHWMPCNDIPIDRATFEVKIDVPEGYTAVANGLLQDSSTKDGVTSFHWKHDFQMPTYLYNVVASKFAHYSDTVTLKSGRKLELPYYHWSNLLPPNEDRMPILQHIPDMVTYYSDFFIEYPYDKYGLVFVPSFGGGMEHNGLVTAGNGWLYGQYGGLAHELVHHWLGNYITCADWQDLWINEGGAVWGTAHWLGRHFGENAYANEVMKNMNGYEYKGNKSLVPPYNLPDEKLFSWELTYAKAGCVYQMMAENLGLEQFQKTLRKMFETYPMQSITTPQFIEIVKQENPDYPLSWDKFFEQWLLMTGFPVFDIQVQFDPDKATGKTYVNLSLAQTQSGNDIPEVFEIPVPIIYTKKDGQKIIKKYNMTQREQSYRDTLEFTPDLCMLYELGIIGIADVKISSVEDEDTFINVYPNVISAGENLQISGAIDLLNLPEISLYNELGKSISIEYGTQNGAIIAKTPNSLPKGLYFLKLIQGGKHKIEKIMIK